MSSESESEGLPDEGFVPQSAEGLTSFEEYGTVGFEAVACQPPPPPKYEPPSEIPTLEFGTAGMISEQEARDALLSKIAEECCWGKGTAEKMTVNSIEPSNGLHYKLETFCEGRTTARAERPYYGDVIDGPFNGRPPAPWEIPYEPRGHFCDQIYQIPVPHTDDVRMCMRCMGACTIPCQRCRATGRKRCGGCHGRGHRRRHTKDGWETHACHRCGGRGTVVCGRCHGTTRVTCPHCDGQGRVKAFIELTIRYNNHVDNYLKEDTDMPDHLIKEASGDQIFEQTLLHVYPLTTFPVQVLNQRSQQMITHHQSAFQNERRLNQRHTIRAVPVTEVKYVWKDEALRFWVYGRERKCWCPDYPQQCCWGCNIL